MDRSLIVFIGISVGEKDSKAKRLLFHTNKIWGSTSQTTQSIYATCFLRFLWLSHSCQSNLCLWSAQWGWGLFGCVARDGRSCPRVGAGDDYADLAKIHRQWLFVRICFGIKKLISTGSFSVSTSVSAFLLTGFAYCVCFVHMHSYFL